MSKNTTTKTTEAQAFHALRCWHKGWLTWTELTEALGALNLSTKRLAELDREVAAELGEWSAR
jgi:hypothetical protein